jgi:hypothetical protein
LVDECHLFVAPMVVGGGKKSLPDNVRLKLELLDERRFGSGMFCHTRLRHCWLFCPEELHFFMTESDESLVGKAERSFA